MENQLEPSLCETLSAWLAVKKTDNLIGDPSESTLIDNYKDHYSVMIGLQQCDGKRTISDYRGSASSQGRIS